LWSGWLTAIGSPPDDRSRWVLEVGLLYSTVGLVLLATLMFSVDFSREHARTAKPSGWNASVESLIISDYQSDFFLRDNKTVGTFWHIEYRNAREWSPNLKGTAGASGASARCARGPR